MNAPPDARSTSSGTQGVRRGRTGALLFLGLFALYLANGKVSQHLQSGDTIPNRLLPFSLLRFGTITADPFGRRSRATEVFAGTCRIDP